MPAPGGGRAVILQSKSKSIFCLNDNKVFQSATEQLKMRIRDVRHCQPIHFNCPCLDRKRRKVSCPTNSSHPSCAGGGNLSSALSPSAPPPIPPSLLSSPALHSLATTAEGFFCDRYFFAVVSSSFFVRLLLVLDFKVHQGGQGRPHFLLGSAP